MASVNTTVLEIITWNIVIIYVIVFKYILTVMSG